VSDSSSNSGAGVETRQPEDTLLILFSVYHRGRGTILGRRMKGQVDALYSWERDSLEGPHDAEAMEWSALKRGKNFVRKDWT